MSKLILKGALAERYGAEHNVRTDDLSEAIRIVDANHPGFRTSFQLDGDYAVFKDGRNIGEDEILGRGTFNTTWIIEPIPYGSKRGGIFQTILGVVLVIIGVVARSPQLIGMGVSMIIGGVASFLSPAPSTNQDTSEIEEDKSSYLFNGPTNKTQSGHARPICYGEVYSSTINIGYTFKHIDLMLRDES